MSQQTLITADSVVLSHHTMAEVRQNPNTLQKGLFSVQSFAPGQVMHAFSAALELTYPTYLTVQTGMNKHITLQPDFLQYINHSCSPNSIFNTTTMQLECIAPIVPGDEITFFYPATEWEMVQPFTCQCGSVNCLQTIQGAHHIPLSILKNYILTDFIKQQLSMRK